MACRTSMRGDDRHIRHAGKSARWVTAALVLCLWLVLALSASAPRAYESSIAATAQTSEVALAANEPADVALDGEPDVLHCQTGGSCHGLALPALLPTGLDRLSQDRAWRPTGLKPSSAPYRHFRPPRLSVRT